MNFFKKIIISITSIIITTAVNGFKICGNYCGENWCNGKSISESECDTSVMPDPVVLKADECCKKHDECCGHGDRKTCNDLLINCMKTQPDQVDPLGRPLLAVDVGEVGRSAVDVTSIQTTEDWFYDHFMDPVICGISINATYVISDFFEAMDIIGNIFGKELCCGTVC
jgi:hypothetical protein